MKYMFTKTILTNKNPRKMKTIKFTERYLVALPM